MSDRGYIIRNQYAIHFITFSVIQWIDIFTRKVYADIVIDSLKYCKANKGLKIYAWCIMSNHLHLIVSTDENYMVSDVIRDFKKFTSVSILAELKNSTTESRKNWMLWIFKKAGEGNNRNKDYQFWQQDNHPIECNTNEILETRLIYLHQNPVRAGLVRYEQYYVYSSGIDYYADGKGLIEIDFV